MPDVPAVRPRPEPVKLEWAVRPDLSAGYYTVVLDDGSWKTFRLIDARVDLLTGPNNTTDYTVLGFVEDGRLRLFRKPSPDLETALARLLAADADLAGFRQAYALKSGRCAICSRVLTVPASTFAGVGPICAKKLEMNGTDLLVEIDRRLETGELTDVSAGRSR